MPGSARSAAAAGGGEIASAELAPGATSIALLVFVAISASTDKGLKLRNDRKNENEKINDRRCADAASPCAGA